MNDVLSAAALELLASDAVATIVTLDADGTPQVSAAWVGVEEGEIVFGTLDDQRKLRNLRRDPRVAISLQSDVVNQWGLREYLVINGRRASRRAARLTCSSDSPGPTSARTWCSPACPTHRPGS